jgi:hypothetical protein
MARHPLNSSTREKRIKFAAGPESAAESADGETLIKTV